ncbi:MAG: hypothetical protein KIT74_04145 [Fimbriimonadales bacterium]|nr:hypothetical protein [Fimbriimonadales bacterium]
MRFAASVFAGFMAALLFTGGCSCSGKGTGSPIGASEELFPSASGKQPITLNLGGIMLDRAELEVESKGNSRTLRILNEGVEIEREVYRVDSSGISLESLGTGSGDQFDPPLTLIRFPAKKGDSVEWEGSYRYGNIRAVNAKATSTTQTEQVSLATGSAEAIRVTVELELSDGSPNPAKRKLDFWFVNGSGPVKRDFGLNQTREPRVPTPTDNKPEEG